MDVIGRAAASGKVAAGGWKTFDGVWFIAFSRDHAPAHVHGFYAEIGVIVELLPGGLTRQAERLDAIQPPDAERSDVRHILKVAATHGAQLMELWKKAHGPVGEWHDLG